MTKQFLMTTALALVAGTMLSAGIARAADALESFPVELVNGDKKTDADWKLIKANEITKPWNICVLFPHLKDSYWVAANYGIADEIHRTGTAMTLYEAGGYTNLSTQLSQMDNCIAQKFDGIILGAISADGVGPLVKKATDAGIPVIDFVNGVKEPSVSGHALVSFYDLAFTTGKYIVEQSKGGPLVVGFFPGPQGAGWSDDAVRGFNDAIKGSKVEVAVTRRGDTGLNVQLDLINNALQTYENMTWIVGVDVAAQAAAVAVRNANLGAKVNVAAFDIIPPVYEDIAAGATKASPTDFTSLQGRLAVDMALRLLEGQTLAAKRAGPKPAMVTAETIKAYNMTDMFAPKGYSVEFAIKATKK
ncbi:TMAO reductase system periplasmic protein TorT [Rhodopseudomonas sp. P2A-2r]|uniref:TMAO reductase system periplasmic protein TorT n=1 Tax=unclassified Rhodopseudomonas TaxID=2638247 RepID=UPI002234AE2D|nr:TMAO reductase system periplasmic protein TorT [Rhodopseudomonas sp. P2A-2r]UZE50918.1 TMAO reductase system periplasmic protein TorT [Rhodopseudomonas sp. P2A-2r]